MHSRLLSRVVVAVAMSCVAVAQPLAQTPRTQASPATADVPPLPFTKFTLANGLEVILSQDRRLPLVAVNLWYHVGPANEEAGRTGFAHLFEHLMFNGSENFNDD